MAYEELLEDRRVIAGIKSELDALPDRSRLTKRRPFAPQCPHDQPGRGIVWNGADIIISRWELPNYAGGSDVVVTQHAYEINRLLIRLKNELSSVHYFNKLELYGRIAERLQTISGTECSAADALREVVDAASQVIEGWIEHLPLDMRMGPSPT